MKSPTAKNRERKRAVLLPSEAAELLGVSSQHILDLIEEGQLGAVNVGGGTIRKHWRITPEAVERFKARRSSLNLEPVKGTRQP